MLAVCVATTAQQFRISTQCSHSTTHHINTFFMQCAVGVQMQSCQPQQQQQTTTVQHVWCVHSTTAVMSTHNNNRQQQYSMCGVYTVHSTVQRSTARASSGSTEQESLNCFLRRAGLGLGLAGPTTPHHTVLLVTAPWHYCHNYTLSSSELYLALTSST